MMNDKELIDWLEKNADDITITRDVRLGIKVTLTFCHDKTGCQCEVTGTSLRKAIEKAERYQG
jgi:hypothetical protein